MFSPTSHNTLNRIASRPSPKIKSTHSKRLNVDGLLEDYDAKNFAGNIAATTLQIYTLDESTPCEHLIPRLHLISSISPTTSDSGAHYDRFDTADLLACVRSLGQSNKLRTTCDSYRQRYGKFDDIKIVVTLSSVNALSSVANINQSCNDQSSIDKIRKTQDSQLMQR